MNFLKEIYFDNASTALPVYTQAKGDFGNAQTTHALGVKAYNALISAKNDLCNILGCQSDELVLTSGGTESNNLAIIGYATSYKRLGVKFAALPWAHPSVTEAIKQVSLLGLGQVGSPLTKSADDSWLKEGINFISIPQVCHETGGRYDVASISESLKTANPKNIIHVDGVQGFCKQKINLRNIDLYSFSGHKIHAASGTGGLFVRKGTRLSALMFGGGQEMGIRPGTQNTHGAVCLAYAAKNLNQNMEANAKKVSDIKGELLKLVDELEDVFVNSRGDTSPYILSMSFMGLKGEVLANMLSEKGVYVSTGAACKVSKKDVLALELMGFSKERASSALRFSFSHHNNIEEARQACKVVIECVSHLRKIRR